MDPSRGWLSTLLDTGEGVVWESETESRVSSSVVEGPRRRQWELRYYSSFNGPVLPSGRRSVGPHDIAGVLASGTLTEEWRIRRDPVLVSRTFRTIRPNSLNEDRTERPIRIILTKKMIFFLSYPEEYNIIVLRTMILTIRFSLPSTGWKERRVPSLPIFVC